MWVLSQNENVSYERLASKISYNFETLFSSEMKDEPLSSNVSLHEKVKKFVQALSKSRNAKPIKNALHSVLQPIRTLKMFSEYETMRISRKKS